MRNYQASYWKEWIMGIDFSGIGSLGIWRLGDYMSHDSEMPDVEPRGYVYSSDSALPPWALHAVKHATNSVGCFI